MSPSKDPGSGELLSVPLITLHWPLVRSCLAPAVQELVLQQVEAYALTILYQQINAIN